MWSILIPLPRVVQMHTLSYVSIMSEIKVANTYKQIIKQKQITTFQPTYKTNVHKPSNEYLESELIFPIFLRDIKSHSINGQEEIS